MLANSERLATLKRAKVCLFFILPRDAMRKRGLCCRPVSSCLSVTLMHCIHTAEDTVKRLSRPGNPITLVLIRRAGIQFQWNPLGSDAKYTGWKKICDFRRNLHLPQKRYEIGPWLLWNVNRKS